MASINAAANAVGGTVVATANMELGKLSAGRFSLLAQGGAPITVVYGIPKAVSYTHLDVYKRQSMN